MLLFPKLRRDQSVDVTLYHNTYITITIICMYYHYQSYHTIHATDMIISEVIKHYLKI